MIATSEPVPTPRCEFLLPYLGVGGCGVEVGVWRGDFSAELLAVTRPRQLHLVDPWVHTDDERYAESWYGRASQADMDAMAISVADRFTSEIASGTVRVHRQRSTEAAATFEAESLDWVYIDGDHTYHGVRRDISAWHTKVRPGGFLLFDDYGNPDGWFGDSVRRAVDDAVAEGMGSFEAAGTRQAVVRF